VEEKLKLSQGMKEFEDEQDPNKLLDKFEQAIVHLYEDEEVLIFRFTC
jgi:hypothetical protein